MRCSKCNKEFFLTRSRRSALKLTNKTTMVCTNCGSSFKVLYKNGEFLFQESSYETLKEEFITSIVFNRFSTANEYIESHLNSNEYIVIKQLDGTFRLRKQEGVR